MLKTLLKLRGDATVIKAEAGNVENWRWHHLVEEVTGTVDECESDISIKFRNIYCRINDFFNRERIR